MKYKIFYSVTKITRSKNLLLDLFVYYYYMFEKKYKRNVSEHILFLKALSKAHKKEKFHKTL